MLDAAGFQEIGFTALDRLYIRELMVVADWVDLV